MKGVGQSLVFWIMFGFLVLIFLIGAQMALKVSVPFISSIDRSLANAIETVV